MKVWGLTGSGPLVFLFEWQGVGNLNNGSNAGLFCVDGGNGLSNANWNIGSRQSG